MGKVWRERERKIERERRDKKRERLRGRGRREKARDLVRRSESADWIFFSCVSHYKKIKGNRM